MQPPQCTPCAKTEKSLLQQRSLRSTYYALRRTLGIKTQSRQQADRLNLATITLVTLLLVVGSVLTFFFAAYVPNQRTIQATATAQVYATNPAQSIASTRAVAEETAQAQATATARQTLYNQTTGGPPTYTESLQAPDDYGWDSATYSDST